MSPCARVQCICNTTSYLQHNSHTDMDEKQQLQPNLQSKRVEDENLTPLSALVECSEQLGHGPGVHVEQLGGRVTLVHLGQRGDCVGNHHRVGIRKQILERLNKPLLQHQCLVNVVQLRHAHGRRLAHVRIVVLEALAQWVAQVPRCAYGASVNLMLWPSYQSKVIRM